MNDYETCSKCGFDHEYEPKEAHDTHSHCYICKQYMDDVNNCPDHECNSSKYESLLHVVEPCIFDRLLRSRELRNLRYNCF